MKSLPGAHTALKDANKNDHRRGGNRWPLTTRGGGEAAARIQDSLNPHYFTSIYTHFGHINHDLKAKMWWNCKMEAFTNESASVCLPVQWDEFSLSEDLTEEEFYLRAVSTLTWPHWLYRQPEGPHSRPTGSSEYTPGDVPQFLQMLSSATFLPIILPHSERSPVTHLPWRTCIQWLIQSQDLARALFKHLVVQLKY